MVGCKGRSPYRQVSDPVTSVANAESRSTFEEVLMTRVWMVAGIFALGLACAGGEAVDGVDAELPDPNPVPTPDPPSKTKRPNRDRDRDPSRDPGRRPGDDDDNQRGRKSCTMEGIKATTTFADHPARNVTDSDPKSAWCESTGGTAIGEELTWTVSDGCRFDRITIQPGNLANAGALEQFDRVKRVRIINDKGVSEQFDFEDIGRLSYEKALAAEEVMELPDELAGSKILTLRIDAVYAASRRQAACIASMKLE